MSSSSRYIADLNDLLRTTSLHGKVVHTTGIGRLPKKVRDAIFERLRTFDEFTPENDPHGEHDFGAFEMEGAGTIIWKIDYFNPSLEEGLFPDPADPSSTRRVLTILHASEW